MFQIQTLSSRDEKLSYILLKKVYISLGMSRNHTNIDPKLNIIILVIIKLIVLQIFTYSLF